MDMPTAEQLRGYAGAADDLKWPLLAERLNDLADRAECEEWFRGEGAKAGMMLAHDEGVDCKHFPPLCVQWGARDEQFMHFGERGQPPTAEDYRAALEFGKAKASELKEAGS